MFEGLVSTLLVRLLGEYVENISSEDLKLAIWSGSVDLKQLVVKATALDGLNLPCEVLHGILGELNLQIPWKYLGSEKVVATIKDVFLVIVPKKNCEWNTEREKVKRRLQKDNKLKIYETLRLRKKESKDEKNDKKDEKGGDSWTSRIVETIINNIEIHIHNVHVRYEDEESNIAFGGVLESLSVYSCDSQWNPAFIETAKLGLFMHKKIEMKKLSIYITSVSSKPVFFSRMAKKEEVFEGMSELIRSKDKNYFVKPITGSAKLKMQRTGHLDFTKPKISTSVVLEKVEFNLDDFQYKSLMVTVDYLTNYQRFDNFRSLRPTKKPKEDIGRWWDYMLASSREQLSKNYYSFDDITRRRRKKDEYIKLFKKSKKLPWIEEEYTKEEEEYFKKLEDDLPYGDIVYFRDFAYAEIEIEEKKHNAVVKKQSWYSGWFGSGTKEAIKMDDEEKKEMLENFKKTILYDEEDEKQREMEIPKSFVKLQVDFELKTTSLNLIDAIKKQNIMTLSIFSVQTTVEMRSETMDVHAELNDFRAKDEYSQDTVFPKFICRRGEISKKDEFILQKKPLIELDFKKNPREGIDFGVELELDHLDIVINFQFLQRIVAFFSLHDSVNLKKIQQLAMKQVSNLRDKAQAQLTLALETRKVIDLNMNIYAPRFLLPQSCYSKETSIILINLGTLVMKSDFEGHKESTDNKISRVEESNLQYYDNFRLRLDDFQIFFTDYHSIERDIDEEEGLLERVCLNLIFQKSITQVSTLPHMVISGNIPEITLAISPAKLDKILVLVNQTLKFLDNPRGEGAISELKVIGGEVHVMIEKKGIEDDDFEPIEKKKKMFTDLLSDSRIFLYDLDKLDSASYIIHLYKANKTFREKNKCFILEIMDKDETHFRISFFFIESEDYQKWYKEINKLMLERHILSESVLDNINAFEESEEKEEEEEEEEKRKSENDRKKEGNGDNDEDEQEESIESLQDEVTKEDQLSEKIALDFILGYFSVTMLYVQRGKEISVTRFQLSDLEVALTMRKYDNIGSVHLKSYSLVDLINPRNEYILAPTSSPREEKDANAIDFDFSQVKKGSLIWKKNKGKLQMNVDFREFHLLFDPQTLSHIVVLVYAFQKVLKNLKSRVREIKVENEEEEILRKKEEKKKKALEEKKQKEKLLLDQQHPESVHQVEDGPSLDTYVIAKMKLLSLKLIEHGIDFARANMNETNVEVKMDSKGMRVKGDLRSLNFEDMTPENFHRNILSSEHQRKNYRTSNEDEEEKEESENLIDFSFEMIKLEEEKNEPVFDKFVKVVVNPIQVVFVNAFFRKLTGYISKGPLMDALKEQSKKAAVKSLELVKEQSKSVKLIQLDVTMKKTSVFCPISHRSTEGVLGSLGYLTVTNRKGEMAWEREDTVIEKVVENKNGVKVVNDQTVTKLNKKIIAHGEKYRVELHGLELKSSFNNEMFNILKNMDIEIDFERSLVEKEDYKNVKFNISEADITISHQQYKLFFQILDQNISDPLGKKTASHVFQQRLKEIKRILPNDEEEENEEKEEDDEDNDDNGNEEKKKKKKKKKDDDDDDDKRIKELKENHLTINGRFVQLTLGLITDAKNIATLDIYDMRFKMENDGDRSFIKTSIDLLNGKDCRVNDYKFSRFIETVEEDKSLVGDKNVMDFTMKSKGNEKLITLDMYQPRIILLLDLFLEIKDFFMERYDENNFPENKKKNTPYITFIEDEEDEKSGLIHYSYNMSLGHDIHLNSETRLLIEGEKEITIDGNGNSIILETNDKIEIGTGVNRLVFKNVLFQVPEENDVEEFKDLHWFDTSRNPDVFITAASIDGNLVVKRLPRISREMVRKRFNERKKKGKEVKEGEEKEEESEGENEEEEEEEDKKDKNVVGDKAKMDVFGKITNFEIILPSNLMNENCKQFRVNFTTGMRYGKQGEVEQAEVNIRNLDIIGFSRASDIEETILKPINFNVSHVSNQTTFPVVRNIKINLEDDVCLKIVYKDVKRMKIIVNWLIKKSKKGKPEEVKPTQNVSEILKSLKQEEEEDIELEGEEDDEFKEINSGDEDEDEFQSGEENDEFLSGEEDEDEFKSGEEDDEEEQEKEKEKEAQSKEDEFMECNDEEISFDYEDSTGIKQEMNEGELLEKMRKEEGRVKKIQENVVKTLEENKQKILVQFNTEGYGFSFLAVDDVRGFDIPLIRLDLGDITTKVKVHLGELMKVRVRLDFRLEVLYYNLYVADWEPLIEEWYGKVLFTRGKRPPTADRLKWENVDFGNSFNYMKVQNASVQNVYSPKQKKDVRVDRRRTLNISVSKAMLETIMTTKKLWQDDFQDESIRMSLKFDAYTFRNFTEMDISFRSHDDLKKHFDLEKGKEIGLDIEKSHQEIMREHQEDLRKREGVDQFDYSVGIKRKQFQHHHHSAWEKQWKREVNVDFIFPDHLFEDQNCTINVKKTKDNTIMLIDNKKKLCVFITCELVKGRKIITVRSGVLIHNKTAIDWDVGVYLKNGEVKEIGRLRSNQNIGVPPSLINDGSLAVKPSNFEDYGWSKRNVGHSFDQLMRVYYPRNLRCAYQKPGDLLHGGKCMFAVSSVESKKRFRLGDVEKYEQKDELWKLQEKNVFVNINAPLSFENLLGVSIKLTVFDVNKPAQVNPGEEKKFGMLKVFEETIPVGHKVEIYGADLKRYVYARITVSYEEDDEEEGRMKKLEDELKDDEEIKRKRSLRRKKKRSSKKKEEKKVLRTSNFLLYSPNLKNQPKESVSLYDQKGNEVKLFLEHDKAGDHAFREISVFSSYWIVNQTGQDILYWYKSEPFDKQQTIQPIAGQGLKKKTTPEDIWKLKKFSSDFLIESNFFRDYFLTVQKIEDGSDVYPSKIIHEKNGMFQRFRYSQKKNRIFLVGTNEKMCLTLQEDQKKVILKTFDPTKKEQEFVYDPLKKTLTSPSCVNELKAVAFKTNKDIHLSTHVSRGYSKVLLVHSERYFTPLSKLKMKQQQTIHSSEEVITINEEKEIGEEVDEDEEKRISKPLLFSFDFLNKEGQYEKDPKKTSSVKEYRKISISCNRSSPSRFFSIDNVGTEGHLDFVSNGSRYDIGIDMSIAPGKFSRTKIITFTSRFRIVNATKVPLFISQKMKDQDEKEEENKKKKKKKGTEMKFSPGDRKPFFWEDVNESLFINVRTETSKISVLNPYDGLGETFFKLKSKTKKDEYLIFKSQLKMAGSTIFLVISDLPEDRFPFVIHNKLQIMNVRVQQNGVKEEIWPCASESKIRFCWDDPTKPQKVDIFVEDQLLFPKFNFHKVTTRAKTNNFFGKKIFASVQIRGPTKILILDETTEEETENSEEGMLNLHRNDKEVQLMARVKLHEIGVSLVNYYVSQKGGKRKNFENKPYELSYVSFDDLSIDFDMTDVHQAVKMDLKRMQMDDQFQEKVLLPVVIGHDRVLERDKSGREFERSVLELSVLRQRTSGIFPYFSLCLQELNVQIDYAWLNRFLDFISGLTTPKEGDESESAANEVISTIQEPNIEPPDVTMFYFESFRLHPILINLTFKFSKQEGDLLSKNPLFLLLDSVGFTFVNCEEAPLRFNALILLNPFVSFSGLKDKVVKHYITQVTREVYKIVGSLDVIGNPVGLFNDITGGVSDLFYEPLKAQTLDPREVTAALAKGASSLVSKTIHGIFNTGSKVAGSIGKGIELLTFDDEFIKEKEKNMSKRPDNLLQGIKSGGTQFGRSLVDSATGIFYKPIEGAQKKGFIGFFGGVGKGLVGVPTKPVAGLFEFAARTSEGISRMGRTALNRKRCIRTFRDDGAITPYNYMLSFMQFLIANLQTEKHKYVKYQKPVFFLDYGEENRICLLTEQCIMMLRKVPEGFCRIIWILHLKACQSFERDPKTKNIRIYYEKKHALLSVQSFRKMMKIESFESNVIHNEIDEITTFTPKERKKRRREEEDSSSDDSDFSDENDDYERAYQHYETKQKNKNLPFRDIPYKYQKDMKVPFRGFYAKLQQKMKSLKIEENTYEDF